MPVYKSRNLCPKIFLEVGGSTNTRTRPIQATIWNENLQNEASAIFVVRSSRNHMTRSHDAVGRSHEANPRYNVLLLILFLLHFSVILREKTALLNMVSCT